MSAEGVTPHIVEAFTDDTNETDVVTNWVWNSEESFQDKQGLTFSISTSSSLCSKVFMMWSASTIANSLGTREA